MATLPLLFIRDPNLVASGLRREKHRYRLLGSRLHHHPSALRSTARDPSFACATPSLVTTSAGWWPCRKETEVLVGQSLVNLARHPGPPKLSISIAAHSVRCGFRHLSSPQKKKEFPSSRRCHSAGKRGIFPGRQSGMPNKQVAGPKDAVRELARPKQLPSSTFPSPPSPPSISSICWVTHHHTDPIARVTSHSILIANRPLTPTRLALVCSPWERSNLDSRQDSCPSLG